MTSFTVASILEKTTNRRAHHACTRRDDATRPVAQPQRPGPPRSSAAFLRLSLASRCSARHMATSDLLAELSKETFKPDSDGERKICKRVLKLLNDQSSEVQGLGLTLPDLALTLTDL